MIQGYFNALWNFHFSTFFLSRCHIMGQLADLVAGLDTLTIHKRSKARTFKRARPFHIQDFPNEIWVRILAWIPKAEHAKLAKVSDHFCGIMKNKTFGLCVARQQFPELAAVLKLNVKTRILLETLHEMGTRIDSAFNHLSSNINQDLDSPSLREALYAGIVALEFFAPIA